MFTRQITINKHINTGCQPPLLMKNPEKKIKTNPKASKYGLLTQTPLVCGSSAPLPFCLRRSLFKSSLEASNQMHNITPSPNPLLLPQTLSPPPVRGSTAGGTAWTLCEKAFACIWKRGMSDSHQSRGRGGGTANG